MNHYGYYDPSPRWNTKVFDHTVDLFNQDVTEDTSSSIDDFEMTEQFYNDNGNNDYSSNEDINIDFEVKQSIADGFFDDLDNITFHDLESEDLEIVAQPETRKRKKIDQSEEDKNPKALDQNIQTSTQGMPLQKKQCQHTPSFQPNQPFPLQDNTNGDGNALQQTVQLAYTPPLNPTFFPLNSNFFHPPLSNLMSVPSNSTDQNPLFEEVKRNIKSILSQATPEIEALIQEYKIVCEAFVNGEFPPKPEGMVRELMPYQWFGYQWMKIFCKFGIGACLGDDMGLGKTTQAIALMLSIILQKEEKGTAPRILICCPSNLVENWQREINSNCPDLAKETYVSKGESKEEKKICIITHQKLRLLRKKNEFPFNQEWDSVIFDEFHTFLNSPASEGTVTLLRKKVQGVGRGFIALTGTPMPNNLIELYKLNQMLNPTIYPRLVEFKKLFVAPARWALRRRLTVAHLENYTPAPWCSDGLEEYVVQLIEMLRKPFMLRRKKTCEEFRSQTRIMQSRGSSVQPLPPQEADIIVSYPLTSLQNELIEAALPKSDQNSEDSERGALSIFNANNKKEDNIDLPTYQCLQSIANHPSTLTPNLINFLTKKDGSVSEKLKEIKVDYSQDGKLKTIMNVVKKILIRNSKDKILIFTNFNKMGNLILEGIRDSNFTSTTKKVDFLNGNVRKNDRQRMIQNFEKADGPPVLIVNRKLGSVGWNCTAANHLIIGDAWWNPTDDAQCIGRILRIGQTKPVNIYRIHQQEFIADRKMKEFRDEKEAWCELILSGDVTDIQQKISTIIHRPSNHDALN
jgi:SNF2 family DNA or RNA helicase